MEGIIIFLQKIVIATVEGGDSQVDVEIKMVRNTLVIRVNGELDMVMAEKLKKEMEARLDEGEVKNLIVNLEKVTFIDSSGLGVIIAGYKKVMAANGRMYIVGAKPNVKRILILSGVSKLIPIYDTEQEVINL
ncbi:anti-anti-sigma regulatory factor, SpoIIAA [Thermosyntropha lipolytica DSM 11003]|uniref:Anti-sigma factor antagonist n=1 Tax=Thermosyntropha lipolytica DSM 11003 TaxID=1123382 RepID=A0A1M5R1K9_9FIRM|nr:anti-anti-sigma regulatory factor, SpoIIAA [Thermosyntropha lipolytica DSM 11003]